MDETGRIQGMSVSNNHLDKQRVLVDFEVKEGFSGSLLRPKSFTLGKERAGESHGRFETNWAVRQAAADGVEGSRLNPAAATC